MKRISVRFFKSFSYFGVAALVLSNTQVFADSVQVESLDQPSRLIPAFSSTTNSSKIEVLVRDEKGVLSGAQVWVEDQNGKLLEKGSTQANGTFVSQVGVENLNGGLLITATAKDHAVVSLVQLSGNKAEFILPLHFVDQYSILSGAMKGFQESDDDNEGMLGMVSKSFSATDLANLEISSLISPLKDTLDIFGPRKVPSNLVIPDQTFPILFVPVRVNKPNYRFPMIAGSTNRYFGASGLVDVQGTVSALRNEQPWEIINLLQFKKVGLTAAIKAPQKAQEVLNLDVNTDVAIKEKIAIQPGKTLNGVEGNVPKRRLALTLWEPEAELFVPTDIKLVQDGFKGLATMNKASAKLIEVLATEEGDRFRSAWYPNTMTKLPDVVLQAGFDFQGFDKAITLTSSANTRFAVVHFEESAKTSIGGKHFEDKWILVAPKAGAVNLPVQALHDLKDSLTKVSHVSTDMLETGSRGYFSAAGMDRFEVVEKVRKSLSKTD